MTSTQSGVKPTSGPLPPEAAKLAIREQRRLWLRYRDYLGRDITERVEPYHLTWLGTLRGWSVTKSVRRTLASGSVESWRLLDESFQHTPTLERWAKWAWLRGDRW
jgi:predicted DNA-binding transcriptional regulator YafY